MESNQDIFDKLAEAERISADDVIVPITFEPFSYIVVQELKKLKNRRERNLLYESIFIDERALLLNETPWAKTTMFPNHKTNDEYWQETKEMAFSMNETGYDVCFLPEIGDDLKGTQRADAIIKINGIWHIADFKYFHSTNDNTLTGDLLKGFQQASTIVLKVQNADAGILREAIEYLKRKKIKFGDLVLMNEYNKIIILQPHHLKSEKYKYLIKGFL